jgi:hypothetical protein
MKKIFLSFLFLLLFTSCIPDLIKQNNKNYRFIYWPGGEFIFVDYSWSGGKVDEALVLIHQFIQITRERGLGEQVIGRFPAGNIWQLGFIAVKPVEINSIKQYILKKMDIPGGQYASLLAKGYPENMFYYWKPFEEWLLKDKYMIEGPVIEIYQVDTFDKNIPLLERTGELRYKVNE